MSRIRITMIAAALSAVALAPGTARAAGYSIFEQGAAVLGMGGAGTAAVRDPSAVFFNPAAMTRLGPGYQVMVGGSALLPTVSFAGSGPYPGYGVVEEMKRQVFLPATVYVTRGLGESFALGAGVNSPFGLGVDWNNGRAFTGRHIVNKVDLRTFNGNLNAAWAIAPRLSIAVGGDAMMASLVLKNTVVGTNVGGGGGQINIARSALDTGYTPGYGWNAALSASPVDALRLGASYRSAISIEVNDAKINFAPIATGNASFDASVAAALTSQAVSTQLDFPSMLSVGLAWLPGPEWTIEGDFNFFTWSVFDETPIEFKDDPSRSYTIVQNYEDSWQARFGVEHRLPDYTYRVGYYYDQAAAPAESVSPILPDANRHGVTLGLGFDLGGSKHWTLDLYQLGVIVERRGTEGVNRDDFDGQYRSFVSATGFNLTRRW